MIDTELIVRRYIAEYSNDSEELTAEYELTAFDLSKFQAEFNEPNPRDPMFDCYEITEGNVEFIEKYLGVDVCWDFASKCYFVEASC